MKLTNWFNPSIKPVHKGWYHTGVGNERPINEEAESDFNWWWDGFEWCVSEIHGNSMHQNRWWRGISK